MQDWREDRCRAARAAMMAVVQYAWDYLGATVDTPPRFYRDVAGELECLLVVLSRICRLESVEWPGFDGAGSEARRKAGRMVASAIRRYRAEDAAREFGGTPEEFAALDAELVRLLHDLDLEPPTPPGPSRGLQEPV